MVIARDGAVALTLDLLTATESDALLARILGASRVSVLRFVVLDGLGRPGRMEGPGDALLAAAYLTIADSEPARP